jgi:hypothetical protein
MLGSETIFPLIDGPITLLLHFDMFPKVMTQCNGFRIKKQQFISNTYLAAIEFL